MDTFSQVINKRISKINMELKSNSEELVLLQNLQNYETNRDYVGLLASGIDLNSYGEEVSSELAILSYLHELGEDNAPQYRIALNKLFSSAVFSDLDQKKADLKNKNALLERELKKCEEGSYNAEYLAKVLDDLDISEEEKLALLSSYIFEKSKMFSKKPQEPQVSDEEKIAVEELQKSEKVKLEIAKLKKENASFYEDAKRLINENYYLFAGKNAQSIVYLENLLLLNKNEEGKLKNTSYPKQYLALLVVKLIQSRKDIEEIYSRAASEELMTLDDIELLKICFEELKENINELKYELLKVKKEDIILTSPASNISYLMDAESIKELNDSDKDDVRNIINRLKGITDEDNLKNIRHVERPVKYDGNKLTPHSIFTNNMGVAYVLLSKGNVLVVCVSQKKKFYDEACSILENKESYIDALISEERDNPEEFIQYIEQSTDTEEIEQILFADGRSEEDESKSK